MTTARALVLGPGVRGLATCVDHVSDDPQVLLELVAAIGTWRMVSGVPRSRDMPLEDGMSSWPPDGKGPA